MTPHLKTIFPRHVQLELLDVLVLELDDPAAYGANEVVVVAVGGAVLVPGKAVLEPTLIDHPRLRQELHRPVHRGVSDVGVRLLHAVVELFHVQVAARLDENF